MNDLQKHDVIVIGAGLSGLHCALELEARGLDVRVVEAQSRSGGRIHSMRQLGRNAEAGGTYIGAGYSRIFSLAERYDINLIDVTPILEFFREQDLALGTEIIRQGEWADHPANPFPGEDKAILPWNYHRILTMRENPLGAPEDWLDPKFCEFDVSVYDWMKSLGLSERAIDLGYGINSSFGADARDVSALLLFFRAAFSKAQRVHAPGDSLGFTVENGVQRIPDAMAEALQQDILFEHNVTAIEQNGTRMLIRCANGSELSADRVVCSIPFGTLRKVSIAPQLEGLQAQAVAELNSQSVTQVYLACKSEFWEDDGYAPSLFTDSEAGMVAAVRSGEDPTQITHLTAWVMGGHAARLDALSAEEAGKAVVNAIERIRPSAVGQLDPIGIQSWGSDPYAIGAWAYFRPGQVRAFAHAMNSPHGRVHFCGEHLAVASRGMEGALESAETVIDQILQE